MLAKLKTVLIVILLSGLIWVFAERAVTQKDIVEVQIVLGAKSGDLLVEYIDEEGDPEAVDRREVKLAVEGPAGKIKSLAEDYLNTIDFDINKITLDLKPGEAKTDWVPVMTLLDERLYSEDGEQYLRVTKAEPEALHILATRLVLQEVPVKAYFGDRELSEAVISPAKVSAYVISGKSFEATINLNQDQCRLAMQNNIVATAHVDLPNRTQQEFQVKIKLPKTDDTQQINEIKRPILRTSKPYWMESKYSVVIDKLESQIQEYRPIEYSGPPEAMRLYAQSNAHLVLKINEDDKPGDTPDRPLEYYLPVGCEEIKILNKKTVPIIFSLQKIQKTEQE